LTCVGWEKGGATVEREASAKKKYAKERMSARLQGGDSLKKKKISGEEEKGLPWEPEGTRIGGGGS